MRRFMVPIIALSLAAAPAALDAQTPRSPRAPAAAAGAGVNIGERIIAQREALDLTTDQVAQIRSIQARLEEQNRPLREQVRTQVQARRAQLTDEQRQQMREQMQQRRAQMDEQRREQMRERREQMRERTEQMTPEQREQMRERMQKQRAEAGARRPARAPFAGARGMELPDEVRATMQQIRQNSQQAAEQIRNTLTAEQQAKMRELRPERRGPTGENPARRRGGRTAPGR